MSASSPTPYGELLRKVEQVICDREVQYARGERMAQSKDGPQVTAFTAVHELIGPIRKVFAEHAPSSETKPRWIPVTERLPIAPFAVWCDPVLVRYDSGSHDVRSCIKYSDGGVSWGVPPGVTALVTHWMEIPQ